MIEVERIGIIGAGIAGLACARRLSEAGLHPVILDKGRGIGGRVATRRTGTGLQFDHGAQYVTAKGEAFSRVISEMQSAGAAALWDDGSGKPHFVGVPGMNALAKHLATELHVRQRAEVTRVLQEGTGWSVETVAELYRFRQLVIATPAPQAARLLGPEGPFQPLLASVEMAPCLTLMAAFTPDHPAPFRSRRDADDALGWIAQNNTKPGRSGSTCWVAQASPDWSRANLERDPEDIARLMVPLLCDRLASDPAAVQHAVAHRWRFARTTAPLGQPFLADESRSLFLGGDWCIGARVEAAWSSGTQIAEALLGPD